MDKIKYQPHREYLKNNLKKINKKHDASHESISISKVDALFSEIITRTHAGEEINKLNLEEEFSILRLSAVCISIIALSIYDEESESGFVDVNWMDGVENPNPNFLIQMHLIQISNYAYSILTLAEKGLADPAKSLVRVITELIEQTLVIISDKTVMKSYISAKEEADATSNWYKLFGRGKLNKKLSKLEKDIGLPSDLIKSLDESRKSSNEYYSLSVHNSYISCVIGARAWNYDKDLASLCFFGGENCGIKSPIEHLNYNLWYFLLMFLSIMKNIHGFSLKDQNEELLKTAYSIFLTVDEVYRKKINGRE